MTSPAADIAEDQIPAILEVPDGRLRAKARPVIDADRQIIADLVPRMFAAMYRAPGIGLAAPQVGVGLRVVVLDLAPEEVPAPMVLINPRILAASDDLATREEGCLSLPGQYADVTRPARITAEFENPGGRTERIDAEGLFGACIQHEIDHLDGVLFVDHLSALKRNMLLRKLTKEQRERRDRARRRA